MAARPRTLQNRKLPPNLYPNGKYWRYRNPVTGVMTSINRPLEEAIKLARAANLKFTELVVDDGSLLALLSPGKTQGYDNPIHLKITMGAALREVVGECMRSPIASPYLIHYKPKARRREQIDAKDHWTSVTPDYLTKEFSKARDAAHAYDHVPAGERPTFHEIRALGSWLYEQQNFPTEYIQALMGHADEKMTKHYQEGHDEKKIEYLEVSAELAF